MSVLPFVSKETCLSVTSEIITQGVDSYIGVMSKEIAEENPYIWSVISRLKEAINEEMSVLAVAVVVYKLLKSQVEADNLKKDSVLK